MIQVTKTFLPSLNRYHSYLKRIWESGWITNNGQLVRELEEKLKDFLRVGHLFFVSNGTTALQIAIKALGLRGDVITTPFSYVATVSALVWEGLNPIFADIDPGTLTIDPKRIAQVVTAQTSAILATHVYGNPAAIDEIADIAKRFNLKVIYDAAHAFGTEYDGKSVLNFGNVSTLSFHATKLFHTGEGGAVVTTDADLAHRLSYMRNFGHKGRDDFWGLGINGKNSEFHAAMGLCLLPEVKKIFARYRHLSECYERNLKGCRVVRPKVQKNTDYNFAYYPIICPSEQSVLKLVEALNKREIYPRRYFYPALNTLKYIPFQSMPIAEDVSRRILCLPLFYDLRPDEVDLICGIIQNTIG